ncbi:MAG: 30S ribosomal protein S4 [Actinomycetota bacterium]|nr:MAG: 30S ribosomal protein S4 [Actinomycetota bacterium]
MRHKPVGKLSRALGIAVSPKAQKVLDERPYRPGVHGKNGQNVTEYGRHLREKQRLRAQYYISESQLRRAFQDAARRPGRTGDNLVIDLERRLDAVVLRSGFARSIYQARQLVSHGHILVNGSRVDRPAFRLQDGDHVGVRAASQQLPVFVAAREGRHVDTVAGHLLVDRDGLTAQVLRDARRDEVPIICDLQLVVEYYAR